MPFRYLMRSMMALALVGALALLAVSIVARERSPAPDGVARAPEACGEYQIVGSGTQEATPDILELTRTIIENRVNATGVVGAIVSTRDQDRVSVELPGIEEDGEVADELRRLISTVGVLEFLPVPPEFDSLDQGQLLPEGMADVEPLFTGVEIANARLGLDQITGEIVVNMELKETGARIFDAFAAEHLGEKFAVVLDGIVITAPSINAERFDGQAQISGNFTIDEAEALVTVLHFGSLPLEISEVEFGACPR